MFNGGESPFLGAGQIVPAPRNFHRRNGTPTAWWHRRSIQGVALFGVVLVLGLQAILQDEVLNVWRPVHGAVASWIEAAVGPLVEWMLTVVDEFPWWLWLLFAATPPTLARYLWLQDRRALEGEIEGLDDENERIVAEINTLSHVNTSLMKEAQLKDDALGIAARTVSADYSLLALGAELVRQGGDEEAMQRLLDEFVRDVVKIVGTEARRSCVWVPEGDWLVPSANYKMPDSSLNRRRFCIARQLRHQQRRGVAGKAFLNGRVEIVHLSQQADDSWKADDADYEPIDPLAPAPQYRSFAAIPITRGGDVASIIAPNRSARTHGVLCVDSMNPTVFDSPMVQRSLPIIGSHLASAFELHEHMRQHRDTQ